MKVVAKWWWQLNVMLLAAYSNNENIDNKQASTTLKRPEWLGSSHMLRPVHIKLNTYMLSKLPKCLKLLWTLASVNESKQASTSSMHTMCDNVTHRVHKNTSAYNAETYTARNYKHKAHRGCHATWQLVILTLEGYLLNCTGGMPFLKTILKANCTC